MTRSFTHSGTLGDVVSSLCIVKLLGGGDFYLKMRNLDKVIQEKLGWPNAGMHSGRMTDKDFDLLEPLMLTQSYVHSFKKWNGEVVTNEFEEVCLHHQAGGRKPRNFVNQYASSQGIDMELYKEQLQQQSWLECNDPIKVPYRPIVIARNTHYLEGAPLLNPSWQNWFDCGLANRCVYVGLEHEHAWLEDMYKVKVPHYKTEDMLHLTRVLAGAELCIGNQSSPLTIAVALGKTSWIERRKNETLENNEIYYPYRINIQYF